MLSMTKADEIKWDQKFSKKDLVLGSYEPALEEFLNLNPTAPILDFACGDGRNSIPIARRGIDVLAWDCSATALERLDFFASKENLAISTEKIDFDKLYNFDCKSFGSVWISHFLPSVKQLEWLFRKLPEGGLLALITFNTMQVDFNPRFCLRNDQFVEVFDYIDLIKYERRVDDGANHDFYIWKK
tara:strand:- start:2072 stop:2629 length:558 start_codon:yes stop_codon:yes gene_type:complete